jgi:proteasome lid subunit RPN8/RPN11
VRGLRAADPGEPPAAVAERGLPAARLARRLMAEVFGHARECYPDECCGLLVGPRDGAPEQVVRCTNMQNIRHSSGESKLDARHGFWINEIELMRALREAEWLGLDLLAVYHSHVDADAYFSRTDEEGALGPDGRPLWPGTAHLVVSVREGVVRQAALFEWSEAERRFVGRELREA